MNRIKMAGFTLIEAMVVVAIAGILSAVAFPSFQSMLERNQLKLVAETLQSDMQFARAEAIKRSRNVVLSRASGDNGNWCYGLTEKASCNCTKANDCEIKQVDGKQLNTTVGLKSANNNSTFNFRRGTVGAGNIALSTYSYQANVVFSNTGRVKTCTPSGTDGVIGYTSC